MRISQIDLEGIGAWPNFQASELNAGLNLLYAGPKRGKSTLARLVGELLYGTTKQTWQPPFALSQVMPGGSLVVEDKTDRFLLQRSPCRDGSATRTVSGIDGSPVNQQTLESLLGDMSSSQAAQLLAVDFLSAPRAEQLLDTPFLGHFGSMHRGQRHELPPAETLDRKRIEQLVARRNAVARQLEERIGSGCRDEELLERESGKLDIALNQRRSDFEKLQMQLSQIDTDLAELNAYLRYVELEESAVPTTAQGGRDLDQRLDALDHEISRCRQTISDLRARWSTLQSDLVSLQPDGSADRVTCLADSRFTVGVIEKLLDDLDAEVAQLARGENTSRPAGVDAHARFSPIAKLLRKQTYSLCGQLSEQERAAQRELLQAEDRQLQRAQTELNDRLEQLLTQRESLIGHAKASNRAKVHSPSPPATDSCRCTGHQQLLAGLDCDARWSSLEEATDIREELQRRRYELLNRLSSLEGEIKDLESRWRDLQEERAGMVESTSVEATRGELDRLELLLKQALNVRVYDPPRKSANPWHASDILAQLSNGKLTQVRLYREEQTVAVIDSQGKNVPSKSLTESQRDQLYLSLTLALVSEYASEGVCLPLVLDEPFLRQDASATRIMTGVLEEFGRAGHQVLVFSENPHARQTLSSLGTHIIELGSTKRIKVPAKNATKVVSHAATKVVRETLDGQQSPGLRIASGHGAGDIEAVFYLSKASSMSEFPVLGSQTAAIFARLSIHTVGDLLKADASRIARQLDRGEIDATTVLLWQSHMRLLCEVPELTLNDAQLLTACGVMSPHDLRHARTGDLWSAISSFLETDTAHRYTAAKHRYTRRQIDDWIFAAGGAREKSSAGSSGSRKRANTRRHSESAKSAASKIPDQAARVFHLHLHDDVEAAPSIGPKTADRLKKIGILTVADLLDADPERTAQKLAVRHIRTGTIAQWQDQSRMVCQIPDLHGYGASLLVACGYNQPQQVAESDPAELISQVQEFCETKQGQRILRSAQPPSAKRIRRWVELAQNSRPLEVA